MSDLGRKDFGDKAQEKLTPDSQKSVVDKATEAASNAGDKVASAVQPSGDKSISQSLSDSTSSNTGEKGIVEQVQEGAEAAYNYAAETANAVINKVSESTK